MKGHTSYVYSVCYSPESKYLASGSYDKRVKIWNTESGICIHNLEKHSRAVSCVTFSPKGN